MEREESYYQYIMKIIAEPEGEANNLDVGLTVCLYVCIKGSLAEITNQRLSLK